MNENVKGIYSAECLAEDVASLVYKQGKAKIFNILEAQINDVQKLDASKRIAEDVLDNIGRDIKLLIISTVEGDGMWCKNCAYKVTPWTKPSDSKDPCGLCMASNARDCEPSNYTPR